MQLKKPTKRGASFSGNQISSLLPLTPPLTDEFQGKTSKKKTLQNMENLFFVKKPNFSIFLKLSKIGKIYLNSLEFYSFLARKFKYFLVNQDEY